MRIDGQGLQLGGQGLLGANGEPRRIVAKNGDGAGNVLRFSGSRTVNNDVRSLFKETVLAVCGAKTMEELPPSVFAVMKSGDYDGKGHPLTVRRITAVPSYIAGLPSGTAEKFMAFYCDAVDRSIAEEIEENYDNLVGCYGMKSLLDELAPVLEQRGVPIESV